MSGLTPAERTLRAQIAANTRWGRTKDRKAATAAARVGMRTKFEREVDPDGSLDPDERDRRVDSLMRAHMQRMTLAAKRARSQRARGDRA